MKLSDSELRQIIRHTLLEDALENSSVVKEFKLRSFGGGSNTEMCDLSSVPEIFWRYFNAINTGRKADLLKEIDADIVKLESSNPIIFTGRKERKIQALLKKREKIQNDDNFFEDTFGKFSKSTTWQMLSGGLDFAATAFFGMTKTDCDRIIAFINLFLEFLAPFLGVDVKTLGVATVGLGAAAVLSKSGSSSQKNAPDLFGLEFSRNLADNGIVGVSRRHDLLERDDIRKKIEKEELIHLDLSLFELYANKEYVLFADDKEADISDAAEKLENLIRHISSNTPSFSRLTSTLARFIDIPPGRNHSKCVEFIESKFPWQDYFESAETAGNYLIKRIKVLKKELIGGGIFGF
jgi:hypothetical protein